MSEFRLTIATDNAAFEDESTELARILRDVAERLESGSAAGVLRDINGNTVGRFESDD